MAKSGTITGARVQNLWLTFEWERTAVDVAKNISTIKWWLKLNSQYSLVFSADKSYTLKINNVDKSGVFSTNINWDDSGGSTSIASGTMDIAHKSDGTKSFDVNAIFYIAVNIGGTQVASLALKGSQILDTIPRASTPTISPNTDVETGDTVKITLNRASANFTHNITYAFGKATGIIGENVETSISWTIPRNFADHMPNSLSSICVITCKTYNGSTLIGTTTVNLKIYVNSKDVPVIDSIDIVEAVSGIASKFNAFIQDHSKLNISIQAKGAYKSTIKKYETKISNMTYSNATFISGVLTESGSIDVIVKVTDSRNRTATLIEKIEVLPYTSPTIALFNGVRANADGVEDSEGTYLKASIRFKMTPLNNLNDKAFKIECREQGLEEWLLVGNGNEYEFDGSYVSSTAILNEDNPYIVRLTLSDYFTSIEYSFDISTAFTLFDVHDSGTGIAFGKVAEKENLFDEALPAIFRNTVHFEQSITYDAQIVRYGSINDLKKSGFYYLGNEVTDRPNSTNGWLEVKAYLDDFIYQRYITYTGRTYERLMTSGVWGDWCGMFSSGMWTYEKRLDGTIHMWGEFEASNIDFNVKVADSWYRPSTNFKLNYPITFIKAPIVFFGTGLGGTAGSVLCYPISSNTTASSFWTQKMVSGVANLKIPVEVIGKWK